ncbi:aminomethyltransferase folate-binding domain protein [Mycobacterium xenopi 3993]|nr:aminomethyltransferase folate-binding domain protein [Mycobacterium xenopi 3993]
MTEHGPLEDRHRELGANFAEFSGWLMPLSYAGTVSEHNATRNAVGLFDVSHLGKVSVRGPAARFVNSALTNDLAASARQSAIHVVLQRIRRRHRRLDRLLHLRRRDLPRANAANTGAVVTVLQAAAPGGVRITNEHRCYAVLAVQGPARLTCSRNWGCRPAWTTWHTPTRRFPASRCGSAAAATPVNMATS